MPIELPWGKGKLAVSLPSGWRILGTFAPNSDRLEAEAEALCRDALAQPLGAQPLSTRALQGKRVLLIADDLSRPTPVARFFKPVREVLLQTGVAPKDLEILFGLGVHRAMTQSETEAKIGRENLAGHRWHNGAHAVSQSSLVLQRALGSDGQSKAGRAEAISID